MIKVRTNFRNHGNFRPLFIDVSGYVPLSEFNHKKFHNEFKKKSHLLLTVPLLPLLLPVHAEPGLAGAAAPRLALLGRPVGLRHLRGPLGQRHVLLLLENDRDVIQMLQNVIKIVPKKLVHFGIKTPLFNTTTMLSYFQSAKVFLGHSV